MTDKITIAYQGEPGAYSDLAAAALYPDSRRIGCASFEEALAHPADYVILPVTNNIAGPVMTALALLKNSSRPLVRTHWQPVHHALLALPGATIEDIRTAHSHWQALKQCRKMLEELHITPVEEDDTAGAAQMVAAQKDITKAAIASTWAAKAYGLKVLKESIQGDPDNKTFFMLLAAEGGGEPVKDALKRYGLLDA